MDSFSILCVLVGLLVIIVRGPLVFAPTATLRLYDRSVSTNARIRGMGVAFMPVGVALIAVPLGEDKPVDFVRASGWLWSAGALWLLAAPESFRRFTRGSIDFLESSVDEAIVRIMGAIAVIIGVALIYYGV